MMYLEHFGLTQPPFSLTPNTQFFLGLTPHIEALQVLQTTLQSGEGFIKVTGEVGTGKTLVCRKIMNELPDDFMLIYRPILLTPDELRWAVALESDSLIQSILHSNNLLYDPICTSLFTSRRQEISDHRR